jgi:hypothetical protein
MINLLVVLLLAMVPAQEQSINIYAPETIGQATVQIAGTIIEIGRYGGAGTELLLKVGVLRRGGKHFEMYCVAQGKAAATLVHSWLGDRIVAPGHLSHRRIGRLRWVVVVVITQAQWGSNND